MTIKQALTKGTIKLKSNNIDSPKLKARLLLQYVLNKKREYLIIYDNEPITQEQEKAYIKKIEKLIEGIPLQHITNMQEFMKMNFYVNSDVLIPRPDTEILVEEAIKISQEYMNPTILDLCTGSGAIAVSLAKYIPNAKVYALDISKKALEVAKINAKNNNVEQKLEFIESDLFENIKNIKFDIIVSNPPYIKTDLINTLDEEVQKEPIIALDGGNDGLDFYRKIVEEAYPYLKLGSHLCFEIGYDQKIDVIKIIENSKKYEKVYCKKDLYGNDRVIITKVK
jgi:release factor glutamine methyltransferase